MTKPALYAMYNVCHASKNVTSFYRFMNFVLFLSDFIWLRFG